MPKRDNHIIKYKLKKGIRYKYKAYLGLDPLTQRKVERTKSGFNTYNDAKIAYDKAIAGGTSGTIKNQHITIDQLFHQWFDAYVNQVKASSANKTYQAYKNHVFPTFHNTIVSHLSPAMIQSYANKLATQIVRYDDPLSILHRMLKLAITLGYIVDDPFRKVILPRKTSRPRRDTSKNFYNQSELRKFLSAAKTHKKSIYVYFMILANTGLRRAEALALTWDDIDFDNNLIDINKTISVAMLNRQIVQPPKSAKSKRQVPMSNRLKEVLTDYKSGSDTSNKLFHKANGEYLNLSKPEAWLKSILDSDPSLHRITLHGFRHTFASLLISSNPWIKPTDVQHILGHETVQMTLNIYTHATDKGKDYVKESLNHFNI